MAWTGRQGVNREAAHSTGAMGRTRSAAALSLLLVPAFAGVWEPVRWHITDNACHPTPAALARHTRALCALFAMQRSAWAWRYEPDAPELQRCQPCWRPLPFDEAERPLLPTFTRAEPHFLANGGFCYHPDECVINTGTCNTAGRCRCFPGFDTSWGRAEDCYRMFLDFRTVTVQVRMTNEITLEPTAEVSGAEEQDASQETGADTDWRNETTGESVVEDELHSGNLTFLNGTWSVDCNQDNSSHDILVGLGVPQEEDTILAANTTTEYLFKCARLGNGFQLDTNWSQEVAVEDGWNVTSLCPADSVVSGAAGSSDGGVTLRCTQLLYPHYVTTACQLRSAEEMAVTPNQRAHPFQSWPSQCTKSHQHGLTGVMVRAGRLEALICCRLMKRVNL